MPESVPPDDDRITAAILRLAEARGRTGSIDPGDAARALGADWQRLLPRVRRVADSLAREGRIEILRKGRPVPPEEARGVVRLRIGAGHH